MKESTEKYTALPDSCKGHPNEYYPEADVVDFESSDFLPDSYRLSPEDTIEIKFFYNPDLNDIVTVRPDGRISLAPLGDIPVRGMTCEETAEVIEERISNLIRNPSVSVIVREFRPRKVFVLGEVRIPGGIDFHAELNLLQALSEAGGLLKTAKRTSIMILRISPEGQPFAIRTDISSMLKDNSRQGNIYLFPDDIIYVPDTFIARVDVFVKQFIKDILPVFDAYLSGYDVLHPDRRYYRR